MGKDGDAEARYLKDLNFENSLNPFSKTHNRSQQLRRKTWLNFIPPPPPLPHSHHSTTTLREGNSGGKKYNLNYSPTGSGRRDESRGGEGAEDVKPRPRDQHP